jgi:hypothetical protein
MVGLAILGSAGAATSVVLTGSVTGLITATVSQALLVRDLSITKTDAQLGTVSDDMTQFTASAEINTGDKFDVGMVLGNESDQDLASELTLIYPDAITL